MNRQVMHILVSNTSTNDGSLILADILYNCRSLKLRDNGLGRCYVRTWKLSSHLPFRF